MKFDWWYTKNDWSFGFGFTFNAIGKAIPGVWCVRPFSIYLLLGPLTLEWERKGRCDIWFY